MMVSSYLTFSPLPRLLEAVYLCNTICHEIVTKIMPPVSEGKVPFAARTFLSDKIEAIEQFALQMYVLVVISHFVSKS